MDICKLWPVSIFSFGKLKAKQPTWLDAGIEVIKNNDPTALKGIISSVDSLKSWETRMLLMHFTDQLAGMSRKKGVKERAVFSDFVAKTYLKLLHHTKHSEKWIYSNLLTRVGASWKKLSNASDKHDAMMVSPYCSGGPVAKSNRPTLASFIDNLILIEDHRKKEAAALDILSFLPEGADDPSGLATLDRFTKTVTEALDGAIQGAYHKPKDRIARYRYVCEQHQNHSALTKLCLDRIQEAEEIVSLYSHIEGLMDPLDNNKLNAQEQQIVLQRIKDKAEDVSRRGFPEAAIDIYRYLLLPLMDPDMTTSPFEKIGGAGMFSHAGKLKDPNKALDIYMELIRCEYEPQACVNKIMEMRDREGVHATKLHKALVTAALEVSGGQSQLPRICWIPVVAVDELQQNFSETYPTFVAPKKPSSRRIRAYLAQYQKTAPRP